MENNERKFEKYDLRGANYHWKQINKKNIFSFNAFVYARYMFLANELKKIIKQDNVKIVDFGCGDGVQLFLINETLKKNIKSIDLFGIDLSEKALGVAKNNINGTFKCASVYNAPFPDEAFDISISSDVIEHVQYPKKMIDEMKRVTKRNGFIMIGTPIKYTEIPTDSMHIKEFFSIEFASLFPPEKFELIKHAQTHPIFYALLYRKYLNILSKKITFFRYILNIIAILFKKNIFSIEKSSPEDLMTYQFIILKNL